MPSNPGINFKITGSVTTSGGVTKASSRSTIALSKQNITQAKSNISKFEDLLMEDDGFKKAFSETERKEIFEGIKGMLNKPDLNLGDDQTVTFKIEGRQHHRNSKNGQTADTLKYFFKDKKGKSKKVTVRDYNEEAKVKQSKKKKVYTQKDVERARDRRKRAESTQRTAKVQNTWVDIFTSLMDF